MIPIAEDDVQLFNQIAQLRQQLSTERDKQRHSQQSLVDQLQRSDSQLHAVLDARAQLESDYNELLEVASDLTPQVASMEFMVKSLAERVEAYPAELHRRRQMVQKLVVLVAVQQRALARLMHMAECEAQRCETVARSVDEAREKQKHVSEWTTEVFRNNDQVATEQAEYERECRELQELMEDEYKPYIADLEKLLSLGEIEAKWREIEQQEREILVESFMQKAQLLEKANTRNALAELEERCDAIYSKTTDLYMRLNEQNRIRELTDKLGDLCLKPPEWGMITLRTVMRTNINYAALLRRGGEVKLSTVQCSDTAFAITATKARFKFALERPWAHGDFRCVFHVRDQNKNDYVGKVFILRRGLHKDTWCAHRVIKSTVLARLAGHAFEKPVGVAMKVLRASATKWKLNFCEGFLVEIEDPLPKSSMRENEADNMTCMMMEEKLDAVKYKKYTSSFGKLASESNDAEGDDVARVCEVVDAFSHWTWHTSNKRFMIVDHQGVYTVEGSVHKLKLTDPMTSGRNLVTNAMETTGAMESRHILGITYAEGYASNWESRKQGCSRVKTKRI
ncbi:alpha-kinase family-domain-containing protein [Jimgerdemannia flammicorona]|uniref:Alpha-kinase family-domain-containing protein n=1 Tax=Jimgerdemannia flammicorona TaxID=994334 RepID=A0A433R0B3_9FUNG|nr:alpha-kinase family-domain-containing protein [Jimgerdemannia flammicorona]